MQPYRKNLHLIFIEKVINMLLMNKVAIITGASRGIGREIAKELARQGAYLILNATNKELLEETKDEFSLIGNKYNHVVVTGDISDLETSEKLVEKAISLYQKVDIVINNAGIVTKESTEEMSIEDWHRVINVNLNGPLYLCKKVLPTMKKQKTGKIINIASRAARHPNLVHSPSYDVSKAGLVSLTKHLALEYGPFGININAICPGPTETDMTKRWSKSQYQNAIKAIPLRRFGDPSEVAQLVVFLASSLANYITGETININGGRSMD